MKLLILILINPINFLKILSNKRSNKTKIFKTIINFLIMTKILITFKKKILNLRR